MAWKIQDESPRVVLFLTGSIVAALVFTTWAMGRVSRWIISHDEVWAKMMEEGKSTEYFLAAGFQSMREPLLWGEVVLGLALLWIVWRAIRPKGHPGA